MTFDIQKVAYLARIQVTQEEAIIRPKLDSVMKMIDVLVQVDTTDVQPLASPLDQYQALRKDEITEKDDHARLQKLAPEVAANLYIVPEVIE